MQVAAGFSEATRDIPVRRTIASSGEGVAALADRIEARRRGGSGKTRPSGDVRLDRLLLQQATMRLRQALEQSGDERIAALRTRLAKGEIGLDGAAAELLRLAVNQPKPSP